jgi:ATPase subunit of ABC transporter with duplicated ATPase domains
MKKIRVLMMAVLLIPAGFFTWEATAQEKTKEEKERELRMQEEFEAQKKAIAEQKKAQEELQKQLKDQQGEIDKAMQEAKDKIDAAQMYKDMIRVYRAPGDKSFYTGEPFMFTPGSDRFFNPANLGDNERTNWEFSRSVKEKSFSKNYSFDVEPTAKNVIMAVNGDCKSGEIRIKIVMPNGKVYSDIMIDEYGNLNWRKSFSISEEENKDKAGEWKFQINATKATGYFKISLQTF